MQAENSYFATVCFGLLQLLQLLQLLTPDSRLLTSEFPPWSIPVLLLAIVFDGEIQLGGKLGIQLI